MMQILNQQNARFRLLIAGEGRLLQNLQRRASRLGVDQQVEFLGFVENMPAFFRSLDVFLLSSHYEGFGYVMAEAMASNIPVVAFDIKSSAEIVQHGETGFITEQNSAEGLAKKVIELADNKLLRERMGQNGRKRVEELFSFEKNREEILELITPDPRA
jgi:glycosyltransferase involved in cell wall biosynthesis